MSALALSVTLALVEMPCAAVPADGPGEVQEAKPADVQAIKKELLKRMESLDARLPKELARKLIAISMKIATGWCSPYLAKEFETELGNLPDREQKRFEKEWKAVREHPAWPGLIADKHPAASPPRK